MITGTSLWVEGKCLDQSLYNLACCFCKSLIFLKFTNIPDISGEAWDDNLWGSFKKEVMLSTRNGVGASILHLFAICNVVKMIVNSIYPKATNPYVNRDVHNQMLFPLCQIYYPENLDGMISILWTHSSNTNLRGWRPNHFVQCFPDVFDVSSSFVLLHTSSTEEKEVNIPSSQSKTFVVLIQ